MRKAGKKNHHSADVAGHLVGASSPRRWNLACCSVAQPVAARCGFHGVGALFKRDFWSCPQDSVAVGNRSHEQAYSGLRLRFSRYDFSRNTPRRQRPMEITMNMALSPICGNALQARLLALPAHSVVVRNRSHGLGRLIPASRFNSIVLPAPAFRCRAGREGVLA